MRERRDTNRDRLKNGLKNDGEPAPSNFQSQGSYAHHTMVQHPEKDYDIDDGVYFWKDALKGPRDGDKSARDAKEMVRKALDDGTFQKTALRFAPTVYESIMIAGYHVDIPVYRKVKTENIWGDEHIYYEIASSDWKESDPMEVTRWFNEGNKNQSPDTTNGRQLRRQTKLNKAFARSRESWRPRIATGFMITTLLVNECYRPSAEREDKALYDTMVAMRNRLNSNLEIDHPTVQGEKLTKGPNDAKTRFLHENLGWAINELQVLFEQDCTREKALKAWDKVFNTDFFSSRLRDTDNEEETNNGGGITLGIHTPDRFVDKRGGDRYA